MPNNEQLLKWYEHEANAALDNHDMVAHEFWAKKFHTLQTSGIVLPV